MLFKIVDNARVDGKKELAFSYLKFISSKITAFAHSNGGLFLQWHNQRLQVNSAGCFTNFRQVVESIHLSVSRAWATQWDSMNSIITCKWDEDAPFLDVLVFATQALQFRRSQQKTSWAKTRSGEELRTLQESLKSTMRNVLHLFIYGEYANQHNLYNEQVPSRNMRMRWGPSNQMEFSSLIIQGVKKLNKLFIVDFIMFRFVDLTLFLSMVDSDNH